MMGCMPMSGALCDRSPLTLAVGDRVVAVARSEFSACLRIDSPGPSRLFEIEAQPAELCGPEWKPILSDYDLNAVPWPGLEALPGFAIENIRPSAAEAAFHLYRWDRVPITDVAMRFGAFGSDGFAFHLTELVDLIDLPNGPATVSVEGILPFDGGAIVDDKCVLSAVAARERLARDFDPRSFAAPQFCGDHRMFFPLRGRSD